MTTDETAGDSRRALSDLGEDSWGSPGDFGEPPESGTRQARRGARGVRPVQRQSLDEALRAMLDDCPTSPRLEQLIRDLEEGEGK
jgi:hypothetical protein